MDLGFLPDARISPLQQDFPVQDPGSRAEYIRRITKNDKKESKRQAALADDEAPDQKLEEAEVSLT